MCYSYREYLKEEEARRKRREELRRQRGERTRQAQKRFADREKSLVRS
jgi:hypothetical protein